MFETLSVDEKRLIVQLPYRVGLYVSKSDESGGDQSDQEEISVLGSIIRGFAEEVMGAESTQHIISTTLALKDQWPEWGGQLTRVPKECTAALQVIYKHIGKKEARAYANQMYEIGEAVALAFKEYEEGNIWADFRIYISYLTDQAKARKNGQREKSFDEYKSISAAERHALKNIAQALRLSS